MKKNLSPEKCICTQCFVYSFRDLRSQPKIPDVTWNCVSSVWKGYLALLFYFVFTTYSALSLLLPCDRRKELQSVWQKRMTLWSSCLHWWRVKRHSYKQQPSLKIFWVLKRWAVSSGWWVTRWGEFLRQLDSETWINVQSSFKTKIVEIPWWCSG